MNADVAHLRWIDPRKSAQSGCLRVGSFFPQLDRQPAAVGGFVDVGDHLAGLENCDGAGGLGDDDGDGVGRGGDGCCGGVTRAEAVGERFACGVVFYLGTETVPFGPNLWAVPVSALWSA